MSERKFIFETPTAQAEPGLDSHRFGEALTPDEIIPASNTQFVDTHIDFYRGHQMHKTADKQARYEIQVLRQQELDAFRVEQTMKLCSDLVAEAAKRIDSLCNFRDSCVINYHPDAMVKIEEMTERAKEIMAQLPEAGIRLFLQRCNLG